MRRGVSLLEVLISVFVLSIGLLGLAALIPVGHFAIVETGKADRSAACGRAGLREIKIRGMLEPTTWFDYNLGAVATGTSTLAFESFAIDPLMIAREMGNQDIERFPALSLANPPTQPRLPRMRRVTLEQVLVSNPTAAPPWSVSLALAERTFVSPDQLLFEHPDDRDLRPRRLVEDANGVVGGYPDPRLTPPVQPLSDAEYSWLVTVTPALVEAGLPVGGKQLYRVSVVVFYKRDFALPNDHDPVANERTVTANMLGGGYGGGDVKLTVDTQNGSQFAQYLDVREDQWLMLCGGVPYVDSGGNPAQRGVFRWYRVIAAGEIYDDSTNAALKCRDVTLAGPDWDLGNAEAALFDGVLGVYTTLVEVDWNLLWGK